MPATLVNANVVIAAHQFNPSIVNQLWLVDNNVVRREEFRPGCVFSDVMVNVSTERFAFLVAPDQVQFAPGVPTEQRQELVLDRLGRFVETLPHTPYSGCGLNFTWRLDDENLHARNRELFFVSDSPLHQAFDVEDSRFGGFMSRPAFEGRLKLDVKPLVVSTPKQERGERLQFSHNFHIDVPRKGEAARMIRRHLENWNLAFQQTEELMNSLERVPE